MSDETNGEGGATAGAAAAPVKRNTRQREAVRRALAESSEFVSAQVLHQRLSAAGERIGLATVYRTLGTLSESEEADSLQNAEGEVVYRACVMGEHHHHLICRNCGAAVEITADPVEQWASSVAAKHGYTQARHVVDIFGLCPKCTAAAAASA
ncbi:MULTISPECIES: Fur family transcriptional regulator [unclassified Pseudoclavibacter]|uniref:Fur family transcriptional regulator n=1 Tax=unclassified Pseudoclavibacter TaxID=2615177 RepID=UPI000CE9099D|nr:MULTISPECIES: transcriptional repressor [unclassified Pseudoclavibacter]PPF36107.1 transcriptional repressor [Pseudoclavibacter sp. AY1H1]PPG01433.1 transcriptional repressor [Pseudoclavibacter sp. RFBI5]